MAVKTKKEKAAERQLRAITKIFSRIGISVRREKLSSGPSFRVKSGNCLVSGNPLIFIDRRLPSAQQLSVLIDYLVDLKIELNDDELELFDKKTQKLFKTQQINEDLAEEDSAEDREVVAA
jgi:hypothetical protein